MKAVYQTRFGGSRAPREEQGNCMAACLASLFEVGIDDIPDFDISELVDGSENLLPLQQWLHKKGMWMLTVQGQDDNWRPLGWGMAGVESERLNTKVTGDGHMVVTFNGGVAHDPNPNSQKGLHEYKIEEYWIFARFDPRGMMP